MKSINELFKDIPETIKSGVTMRHPNDGIVIYSGEFKLTYEDKVVELGGQIEFKWYPSVGVEFRGFIGESSVEWKELLSIETIKFDLIVEGLIFGKCLLTKTSFGERGHVEGTTVGLSVKGDKSIGVSKIRFCLLNFRDFLGGIVKEETKVGKNRLVLESDDFKIILDKKMDFKAAVEVLRIQGGYFTTWNGEITKTKGNILFDEIKDELECLTAFLTFVNGKRCSPMFIQGLHEEQVIWTDYSAYSNDQHKNVSSWAHSYSIEGLAKLWTNFRALWKKGVDHKDFLVSAIHWYVEANMNSGRTEGAIIMAQTALELIYNWYIVEQLKLIVGKDAESIIAANKIRLLISQLKTGSEIPSALSHVKAIPDVTDGPDAFVKIRNAIVHSQEEKRKTLRNIHPLAMFDALQLGLWYTELSLLKILDFNGDYQNRCVRNGFKSEANRPVPWK